MKKLLLKSAVGFGFGIVLGVVSNKIDDLIMEKEMERQIFKRASEITIQHPFSNLK
ncbi:hypothetical protein CPT_MarsHill_014 [Staphylococcus phage MarsHill]|nr:hypothetical protein CPT_MarsHill_014 [Staphylococcus phage MarsHill]QQO92671.1 hypothetical protein CPT_Madawaska_014 [Staphylococcus phage Madawaska]